MKKAIVILFPLMVLVCAPSNAQRLSLGANALDCIDLGTLNGEVSVALSRHISIEAGAKYNPWSFGADETNATQDRKRSLSLGLRYWLWSAWSGWWFSIGGQAEEYNRNFAFRDAPSEEGDAIGAALGIGYALMLTRHFNIDLGMGLWGGGVSYTRYACPRCGRIVGGGHRGFIKPNDIQASLVYIF